MESIGRYEITGVIGDGGMGTVYKGRDPRFDSPVAIKVIHEHLARDPATLERFKSEAVIQARLQHPNIVTVHDFLLDEHVAAIVMEYVDGKSLTEVLAEVTGPMPYPMCCEIMSQVLNALGFAHAKGLIHRDIKPSNIMIQWFGKRVHAKIMDFGIAKILGDEKRRTNPDAKLGTFFYSSPEQIRSPKDVDARSDIYSLGCTLYEMATGVLPFQGDSEYEVMTKVITQDPPLPSERYPHISKKFEQVILRAMAKDPDKRFSNCEEFLEALLDAGTLPPLVPEAPAETPGSAAAASKEQAGPGMAVPPGVSVATGQVAAPTPEGGRGAPGEGAGNDLRPRPPDAPAQKVQGLAPRKGQSPLRYLVPIVLLIAAAVVAILVIPNGHDPDPIEDTGGGQVPTTGTLIVNMQPAGRAYVDDFYSSGKNSTKHEFLNLSATGHTVKVWWGHHQQEKKVSIEPGKTISVSFP